MKQDLITLSEQFPGIMVQVSLEDLLTAGRTLSEEIIERIDQKADYAFQNKPQQEEFITREETCNKLGVSSTTLWRWKKCGYLVPVQLGAMDRYRISDINANPHQKRRCAMSKPMHISEVMHQLVLNNPDDPWAQILRHCPFIQIAMLKKGYMSLDDLTDEEIDRLIQYDLEGLDIEELKRKEAQND